MTVARLLLATVVGLILLFLVLPIVVVMVVSFSSATYLTFPPPAFGIRWYTAYFSSDDWLRPTWLSLWVAACVVVLTEWEELRWLDFTKVRDLLAEPNVVDARNLLDPAALRRMGFTYVGMGRR